MGQIVQTNGDYQIRAKTSSEDFNILLNVGPTGQVRVTGNLIVDGDTLTVSANDLIIDDNVITINNGDPGPGVTLEYSGFQINRGFDNSDPLTGVAETPASLLYEESSNSWMIVKGSAASRDFNFTDSAIRLQKILTDPDTLATQTNRRGDLILIDTGTGVVSVGNVINYHIRVSQDNDIPNKKYVDDAIESNPTFQIVRNAGSIPESGTRVVAFDKDDPLDPLLYFPPAVGPYTSQPSDSLVSVIVDGQETAQFYSDHVRIQGLDIRNEQGRDIVITSDNTSDNIIFVTNGTGKVEFNAGLQLDYQGIDLNVSAAVPASQENSVILYTNTPSLGATGLYFVNTDRNDELISKNKALLYSMIF